MLLDELLWGKTPLGRDVIGTAETVGAISRKNIAAFLEQHYTAPRILIVVCAKAGVPELKKIIAGKFTGYSGSKRPVTKFNPSSVQPGVRIKVERKELAQTHCALGVEGCTRKDPRVWALKLLHVILGANMSSRLFERIREEQALAYDISTACRFYRDSGCFSIHSGLAPEHLGCALRLILKELEKIKRVAVGKKEFQRARDFVLGQMTMAFEHPMERMLYIGESLLGLGIVPSPDEMRQKIIGISTGTIKRLAERLFSGRTMKVALVGSIETAFKTEIEKTLRSAGYHAQER
jgi:predicted Zn-dependent peptidase